MTTFEEPLLTRINKGLYAGMLEAIAVARRTGTNLVVSDANGEPIEITPDQAEARLKTLPDT
jgi:hypothetical protein